jgi:hypothetical protein
MFDYLELPPFNLSDWLLPEEEEQEESSQKNHGLDLLPLTFSPEEKEANQAQNAISDEGKRVKGKRVKGPNHDAILEAMDDLEAEGKALTMNAIARKASLTRHQYEEIEDVAIYYGYELVQGKGRPVEK